MKADIHPKQHLVKVHCSCGNEFETLSTAKELRLDICGSCHPFFTGKKRAMAAAGRVQRFAEKYGDSPVAPAPPKKKPAPAYKSSPPPKGKASTPKGDAKGPKGDGKSGKGEGKPAAKAEGGKPGKGDAKPGKGESTTAPKAT